MAISVKSFIDITKKDVFTNKGVYCGKVMDLSLDLEKFRVKSVIIDAVRGSYFASLVGDKKGVIVPFTMVQSIGDIVIVKHVQPPASDAALGEEKPMMKV
jgi:sporulation protein YlmC with PRC-barrel domain